MTVFVTGGAGFIGSHMIENLLSNGEQNIVNLDKMTYAGVYENILMFKDDPRVNFVKTDIGDVCNIHALLREWKPHLVLNFAAESHVDNSIEAPAAFIEGNTVATFNLLNSTLTYWRELPKTLQNKFRFLQVSTDEVFGSLDLNEQAFSESTAYSPNSPYSASKASADHFVRAFHHTFGLPTLITNCSNNYGPRQFPEKLIPIIIMNAITDSNIPIYGNGEQIRDWLHVKDHCSAIKTVLDKGQPGETYNVGGKCEKSNLEIAKTICSILDTLLPKSNGKSYAELITFVTDRPGHDTRYAIDARKIENELNWSPTTSFDDGMLETVDWYINHQDWVKSALN
tara:strand:- start:123 stop:1145 length:1023 start_codon:yes stop_codon:yes gene_type:complete